MSPPELSVLFLYSFHFTSSQISKRSLTPAIITLFFKPAYSLRKSGTRILPKLSRLTSMAPVSINLEKPRASAPDKGSLLIFSTSFPHSLTGYSDKQLSKPLVITAFFPKDWRSSTGMANLFLSSIEYEYSPMNMLVIPRFNYFSHCYPQLSTIILSGSTISHQICLVNHSKPLISPQSVHSQLKTKNRLFLAIFNDFLVKNNFNCSLSSKYKHLLSWADWL